jgi:hypothetical protein
MIWKAIPHCIMWCLWIERNLRSFDDIEMGVNDLKILCFRTLFDWINASGCFSLLSLQVFLDSCNSLNH